MLLKWSKQAQVQAVPQSCTPPVACAQLWRYLCCFTAAFSGPSSDKKSCEASGQQLPELTQGITL